MAEAARLDVALLLVGFKAMLYGAFMWCNFEHRLPAPLSLSQASMLSEIPSDIRTVISKLDLEPDIVRHTICPSCRATYAPNKKKPHDPYPHRCTNRDGRKKACGETLVVKKEITDGTRITSTYESIQFFPYRPLESWIAEMLQRPGLAEMARAAWSFKPAPGDSEGWKDIWDAPIFREFKGPDKQPFSKQPDNHIHLVFSLFVDWFNPFGNKKAGKSHSVGAIYLVCLNLPPDVRYRPENIYLAAIIPGPHEPELHQVNHFLRPLIDDLLVLWHRGFLVANTGLDGAAVTVCGAVIPLICDLPALRKVAGFAHYSSAHFCSFCQLRKSRIGDLNRATWPRRTRKQHHALAEEWKKLDSEKERDDHFDLHGLRWSELLRLPYWDPTRFAVVDAMHNLFLGELRHHCREIWGIDIRDKTSDNAKVEPHTPKEQQRHLEDVVRFVKQDSFNKLMNLRKGYVAAVAELNGAVPALAKFTKKEYSNALLRWVSRTQFICVDPILNYLTQLQWKEKQPGVVRLPPVLSESTKNFQLIQDELDISRFRILDQNTLASVREDIVHTKLPSWLQSPPKNFGSVSHGKLKADQWRTACLVSLVISLVRMWGIPGATTRQKTLLRNFLDLVRAIDLATRRSMGPTRAKKFDEYMLRYLTGLQELFKEEFVPNHHMSLHLRECLELFGPVHGWWAYPFERFNGLIQNLNTNYKSSK